MKKRDFPTLWYMMTWKATSILSNGMTGMDPFHGKGETDFMYSWSMSKYRHTGCNDHTEQIEVCLPEINYFLVTVVNHNSTMLSGVAIAVLKVQE